jgi:hypothetical protein
MNLKKLNELITEENNKLIDSNYEEKKIKTEGDIYNYSKNENSSFNLNKDSSELSLRSLEEEKKSIYSELSDVEKDYDIVDEDLLNLMNPQNKNKKNKEKKEENINFKFDFMNPNPNIIHDKKKFSYLAFLNRNVKDYNTGEISYDKKMRKSIFGSNGLISSNENKNNNVYYKNDKILVGIDNKKEEENFCEKTLLENYNKEREKFGSKKGTNFFFIFIKFFIKFFIEFFYLISY